MQHGLNVIETRQVKHIHYGARSPYMDLKLRRGGALELVIDPEPNLNTLCAALETLHGRDLATLSFAPEAGLVPSGQGGLSVPICAKTGSGGCGARCHSAHYGQLSCQHGF
jgi:hypothetical protein